MPISLRMVDKTQNGAPAKGPKRPASKEKEPFSQETQNAPAVPVGANRRILVVDDNPVVLKAFELKLKSDGFTVIATTDSSAVASTTEQERVELIILDVNFPPGGAMEWNGFTVMQWMRRFPELANIPVILISGSDISEMKTKALEAGAVAFFQKPVDHKELLETILKTLGTSPGPAPH